MVSFGYYWKLITCVELLALRIQSLLFRFFEWIHSSVHMQETYVKTWESDCEIK